MEYNTIHLTTVNSTNSYLKELDGRGGLAENTVVITDYQDTGRGQGEHIWISEKRKNLLFSWIVFPAFLAVSEQFRLSKAVSLGIADALEEIGLNVQIKWPNDIICNSRKIGGILIENSILGAKISNSIIGVGINVNQKEFPSFPLAASSIHNELKNDYDVMTLFNLVMEKLLVRYNLLVKKAEEIDQQYTEGLYRRNIVSEFEADNVRFRGKIIDVNDLGELEIDVSGNIRTYGFHSLRMII